jgi:hypothetical protein
MDESTDVSDTAKLAIFVWGTDNEFNVTEELAGLMAMKGMTTSEDLHDEIEKVLQKLNIPIQKLVGVVTDGHHLWPEGTVACLRLLPTV